MLALSVAGYLWLGWSALEDAHGQSFVTPCLFKEVTHLPCPSCGTTRSMLALLRGDVVGAIHENPLGILLALALAVIPGWILIDAIRRRDSFYRAYIFSEKILAQNAWVYIPCLIAILVNWIWNIVKGI